MLRNLGIFERALLLPDKHSQFNVISILRLTNAPTPDIMRKVLGLIQQRHPLFRACIAGAEEHPGFFLLPQPILPYVTIDRSDET